MRRLCQAAPFLSLYCLARRQSPAVDHPFACAVRDHASLPAHISFRLTQPPRPIIPNAFVIICSTLAGLGFAVAISLASSATPRRQSPLTQYPAPIGGLRHGRVFVSADMNVRSDPNVHIYICFLNMPYCWELRDVDAIHGSHRKLSRLPQSCGHSFLTLESSPLVFIHIFLAYSLNPVYQDSCSRRIPYPILGPLCPMLTHPSQNNPTKSSRQSSRMNYPCQRLDPRHPPVGRRPRRVRLPASVS